MALHRITEQVATLKAAGLSITDIDKRAGVWTLGSDEQGWEVSGLKDVAKIDRLVEEVAPTVTATQARPAAATSRDCGHGDIDNNGICYGCGHHFSSHDVGAAITRMGVL